MFADVRVAGGWVANYRDRAERYERNLYYYVRARDQVTMTTIIIIITRDSG